MQLILETDALETNMSNFDVDEKIIVTNGLEKTKNGEISKAYGNSKPTKLTDDIDEISVENGKPDKEEEKNTESAHESDQSTEPVKGHNKADLVETTDNLCDKDKEKEKNTESAHESDQSTVKGHNKADLVESTDNLCDNNSLVPLLNASDSIEKSVLIESDSTENKHEDVAEQDEMEIENHATAIKENGEENPNKEEECQIEENINEQLPDHKPVIENNVLENNTQPIENTDANNLITFETTDDNSKTVDLFETDFKKVEKSTSFDEKEINNAPIIENIPNEAPSTNVVVEKVTDSSTRTQSINLESETESHTCTEENNSQDNETEMSIISAKTSTATAVETMDCVTDENIEENNIKQPTLNEDVIYIDDGKKLKNNDLKECEMSIKCNQLEESVVEVEQDHTVDSEKGVMTKSSEQDKPVVSTLSSDSSDDCVEVKEFSDDPPKSIDKIVKEKEIESKNSEETLVNTVKPDVVIIETNTITECKKKCSENENETEEINDEEQKDTIADLTECTSLDSDKKSSDSDFKVKRPKRTYSGLSNTLNILSDDEDDVPKKVTIERENKCVDVEDDDDVMLIDDELATKDDKIESKNIEVIERESENNKLSNVDSNKNEEKQDDKESESLDKNETTDSTETSKEIDKPAINVKPEEKVPTGKIEEKKPLVPTNFLKTFKKNVAEMTRDELEEFCLLKIVEGVVDRSNLSEIKGKLKILSQNIEEWRKKALMLTKQNRDLQIVLKTVQEEQKKKSDLPIAPLKITRSVGMQVYMADCNERGVKRKAPSQSPQTTKNKSSVNANTSTPTPTKPSKQNNNNVQIPVPRLVPALNNSPAKNTKSPQVQNSTVSSNSDKASPAPVPNGVKNTPPVKAAEKRTISSAQSDTVDLTDDEPPTKQMTTARNSPQAQPVRLINQNQLLTPRAQSFNQQNINGPTGPRKVYIPINQNQAPMMRPGQTIMLKSCPPNATRPRANAPMIRLPGPMRISRPPTALRHPAPLPTVAKQQQPPNWKALPPAPDLKISKVENGIVISWKIEGYQEDSYETIASYQLYAYQETSSPSTLLWKKIGDVKALPLPMACTLTQFVAGYKYYFAVRAVDIRSRIGPFSLPGSILLLNK